APACIDNQFFPKSLYEHPGWMDPALSEQSASLANEAHALISELEQRLDADDRVWFFYEGKSFRKPVLDILKGELDQDMVLIQTVDAYGTFFDSIRVYTAKR